MDVKTSDVSAFLGFIYNLNMPAKDSRLRMELIRSGQKYLDYVHDKQQDLLNRYAVKDEKGNMKVESNDNETFIPLTDSESYEKELTALYDGYWTVDDKSNKDILQAVKKAILDYGNGEDIVLQGDEAKVHDIVCRVAESIGDGDSE